MDIVDSRSPYYVGVGASAGGLEALEDFFKAMPDHTGLVFVVIQHLSPDYKSLMNELLARYTKMSIHVAEDGMETHADSIYLIPPRQNLTIFHGKLFLTEHTRNKQLNLPIDIFFKSLAKDQEKKAIGVILSGTGSDGTLGVRAIKEAGGMIMVQDETTAKFDGMPKSSISTGLVDYILPPQAMADELLNYIGHPSLPENLIYTKDGSSEMDELTRICMILRSYCGIDFSLYKESTVIRRLDRRVKINRAETLQDYIRIVSESDKEKEILYRELLIGVTAFFRDQEAYKNLREKVLPSIDYSRKMVRIWSAACSTGEEVYSLAILFSEYLADAHIDCEIKIFATDVDSRALEMAGIGYYPDSLVAEMDPDLLLKYFVKREGGYQITDGIRKMVVFANHNILKDPPFSKLSLLICRNLFIYLKTDRQQQILSNFYYSLAPNGYLFLGSSESVGDMSSAFKAIDSKWKIYQYREGYQPPLNTQITYGSERHRGRDYPETSQSATASIRLETLLSAVVTATVPPSIIVDRNENIVHVINDVTPFLKTQPGRFSNNFNSNMNKELALFVNNIIRRLKEDRKDISLQNVYLFQVDSQMLTIMGHLINESNMEFYLISFILSKDLLAGENVIELDMSVETKERVKQLEGELQLAREGLQATIEELETSNEELQSSNEELIASNEELQSTNEELQSVNEELYTVNNEYQSKIEELIKLNNDLNNLIKNTEIGALYLDHKLCIRRMTPNISKLTNMIESDIGRPIHHFLVMENYPDIIEDIHQVIDTLVGVEKEIVDAGGNVWLVRIRPYRTEYNAVDGTVLTFMDINALKHEQEQLRASTNRLNMALKMGNIAWWEYYVRTGHVEYSPNKATMLGYTVQEFPNDVYEICSLIHPDDYGATMQAMRDHLEGRTNSWNVTYRILRKDGAYSWYHDRGSITERDEEGNPVKLVGTVVDVSNLKEYELKAEPL